MDDDYSSVSLLIPMVGENNSTAFKDFSPSPKTITRVGDAKTVTGQSKYYGSSMYLDGAGDYLQVADDSAFQFGTGDFTVEAWVRLDEAPSVGAYVTSRYSVSGNNRCWSLLFFSGNLRFNLSSDGINFTPVIGTTAIQANTWYHCAASRESGTVRLFLDGALEASLTFSDSLFGGTIAPRVGSLEGASFDLKGHINDVRVTKGVARYTAAFTPPDRLCGKLSGTVEDVDGDPAVRDIFVHEATTGALVDSLESESDGTFETDWLARTAHRIVFFGEPDRNDLIFSGVGPI